MNGKTAVVSSAGGAIYMRHVSWSRIALMALAVIVAVAASSFFFVPKAFAPVIGEDCGAPSSTLVSAPASASAPVSAASAPTNEQV